MKKVLLFLLGVLIFLSFPALARAENKAGINIGDHWQDFDRAASIVGSGGWIVVMACPGDGDKLAQVAQKHPEINIVIRGHYPGQYPPESNNKLAKLWGATLASIPFPSKVYFMPWNEPNHENEGGGASAGNLVYSYGQFLKAHFQDLGILNSKVVLLSPMVDKLNPSFTNNLFFTNSGGKQGFYSLFSGSSINEYDQFSPGPCSASAPLNNCLYDQIGIPGPYYAPEAGVAGTCSPPCYRDNELRQMLDRSWQKWQTDSSFKMFALFSYDPHRTDWDIFSNGTKTVEFLKNISNSAGGCCTQSISPSTKPSNLTLCPGKQYSFYLEDESDCGECGSFNLISCLPISGQDFGDEYSRSSLDLQEQATYGPGDDCLEVEFKGTINVNDLQIPLIKKLTGFLLGDSGDLPTPGLGNSFSNSGPLLLLTSKQAQDDLKIQFLEEVNQRGVNSKYANLKIQGLSALQIKEKFQTINKKYISERSASDKAFLSSVWSKIPLFANEESEGNLFFLRRRGDPEPGKVRTSVPEVYRAEKVTNYLGQLLVPGFNQSQTLSQKQTQDLTLVNSSQVLAEKDEGEIKYDGPPGGYCPITLVNLNINQKESIVAPGEPICTELEENKLSKTRAFWNDAQANQCQALETDCKGGAKAGDACCNNHGKCQLGESGYLFCSPNNQAKSKDFEDDYLSVLNQVPQLEKIKQNAFGGNGFLNVLVPAGFEDPSTKDVAGEAPSVKMEVEIKESFIQKVGRLLGFSVNPQPLTTGVLFHQLGTYQKMTDYVSKELLGFGSGSGVSLADAPPVTLEYEIDFRNNKITISQENKNSVITKALNSWPQSKIKEKWDLVYGQAITNGWNPAFVIALWIEESGASGVSAYDLGCLAGERNNLQSQLNCFFARPYKDSGFANFMCMYSEGENAPCVFDTNPHFTTNLKIWYDRLIQ